MSCQHLNELTLETMISKANYPVFRCEECLRVGDRSGQTHLNFQQTRKEDLGCRGGKLDRCRCKPTHEAEAQIQAG